MKGSNTILFPLLQVTLFRGPRQTRLPLHKELRNTLSNSNNSDSPLQRAESVFSFLASRSKSWKRLGSLLDLFYEENQELEGIRTAVDVGTDHGLLAMGLAASEKLERVIGVDVSDRALQDGALKLQREVELFRTDKRTLPLLNVEFRSGDGLSVLDQGEADAVFIAGMGVHSIMKILSTTVDDSQRQRLTDKLQVQRIIVQPTNSKPSNLISLYRYLQGCGWQVASERIEKVSTRWYVSTLFTRARNTVTHDCTLPGEKLLGAKENSPDKTWNCFQEYANHHCIWIQQDIDRSGQCPEDDMIWLHRVGREAVDS